MYPGNSRYSARSFVTQPALSATWPTIDPTRSSPLSSRFLPLSHRHPSLFFLSFSLSGSFSLCRVCPSIALRFLHTSLFLLSVSFLRFIAASFSLASPLFFPLPLSSLSLSIPTPLFLALLLVSRPCRPFYFHQHQPPSLSLPLFLLYPSSSLSLFVFTLPPYINFCLSLSLAPAQFLPLVTLSPCLLRCTSSLAIAIPTLATPLRPRVLLRFSRAYPGTTRWGATCSRYPSHARVGHVVRTLYGDA